MQPTYDGSYWTSSPPTGWSPWLKGNLPDPTRRGDKPLISSLRELKTENSNGKASTDQMVSQLLWAARGRTPHYVNGQPWGLTIPTWGGGQKYTEIHLLKEKKLFRYINWRKIFPFYGNPTHDIRFIKDTEQIYEIEGYNHGIILSIKENTPRALWEIGYMIENMLLQARGLKISFKTKFLQADEYYKLSSLGIKDALVILLL